MADYYDLVTALPWLPELEQCKQLPLSRIALDRRLTMLTTEDAEQLRLLEGLYHLSDKALSGKPDKALVSQLREQIGQIESPVMLDRIMYQLELKTLLAAFRVRESGQNDPALFYGLGRWVPRIRKHWFEAGFGLEEVYPMLSQLQRVLEKGQPILVERFVTRMLWQDLAGTEHQHSFQFEAVACFVLRWGLATAHLQQQPDIALEKFNHSADALLRQTDLSLQMAKGVG